MATIIDDQPQRLQALDPSRSFIVQAPAGSGKTGLLTQRFLVLLARVNEPEEIIAITFTRKAAAEMRQRILQALREAAEDLPAEDDFARQTRQLAREALVRDRVRDWQLLDHSARLRIQTIDSLCAWLVGQMPVVSGKGALPAITENADDLYLEAARLTLLSLEEDSQWSTAIAHLIRHLDNCLDRLQRLIANMLADRDQWLRHVANSNDTDEIRSHLQQALERQITAVLRALVGAVPADRQHEIIELACFAAARLQEDQSDDSSIRNCHMLSDWPGGELCDRPVWEGIAELLLTQNGEWRKQVTIRQGFPSPGKEKNRELQKQYSQAKQRMQALLVDLQQNESFRQGLMQLRLLPPAQYEDSEWETLQALFTLLKLAAANLVLVFQRTGTIDFCEMTLAAIRALGTAENPSDLALALDYRINHLLVDEFQDTSFNQAQLLRGLTAGWQAGDGRTLFLVGDPMQSIYRFRQAEVGLFLDICERGCFGQIPVEFLRLTFNFRSQAGIVNWINQHFQHIFPTKNDVMTGAVTYAAATAFHPAATGEAVHVFASLQKDDQAEAAEITQIIQRIRRESPEETIAILVRNRSHLAAIVTSLRQAKLPFQAVEIETLGHQPVIRDLNALTRALLHVADRVAWLALLRAPFCGLLLADLHTLVHTDLTMTVMDCLSAPALLSNLSEDGRLRCRRIQPVLMEALALIDRVPLPTIVESVWLQLGGPACVTDDTDFANVDVYLESLQKLEAAGIRPDVQTLDEMLTRLFASADTSADGSLQIMTMHKAKGLEFDTVILPGLGKAVRPNQEKLFNWMEFPSESDVIDLVCAPISSPGGDKNPVSTYLMAIEQERTSLENARLLYVAATRARKNLYLFGQIAFDAERPKEGISPPPANTLLAKLWPAVEKHFLAKLSADRNDGFLHNQHTFPLQASVPAGRLRLMADWQTPPPEALSFPTVKIQMPPALEPTEFSQADETARLIGVVLHRLLQYIGQTGIEKLDGCELESIAQRAPNLLRQFGIALRQLEAASHQIKAALEIMCGDARGRWILSNQHAQARCEWALSAAIHGEDAAHIVIDRTFIDADGRRWIIDYKTSNYTGGDMDVFLDQEQQRHAPQLTHYASILNAMEGRQISLGLYFPLLGAWREWQYQSDSTNT